MQRPPELIFGVSGTRGIVGEGLDPITVCALGAAFGSYLGRGPVVVGRDSRLSGPVLSAALESGLMGVGCDVIRIGIVPTPTVQNMVRELGAAGGIAVTASHNPAEWNALKFLSSRGIFLTAEEGARLKARIDGGRPDFAGAFQVGSRSRRQDFPSVHVDEILASPLVDAEAVRARGLRAVVDCVAGAGTSASSPRSSTGSIASARPSSRGRSSTLSRTRPSSCASIASSSPRPRTS